MAQSFKIGTWYLMDLGKGPGCEGDRVMVTVPNSCPHYRYKPKQGKVTTCDGDVIFQDGASYGVCQSCKNEVPLILEMWERDWLYMSFLWRTPTEYCRESSHRKASLSLLWDCVSGCKGRAREGCGLMTNVRIDEDTKYLIDKFIQSCRKCKIRHDCKIRYWSRIAVIKAAILSYTQDKDCEGNEWEPTRTQGHVQNVGKSFPGLGVRKENTLCELVLWRFKDCHGIEEPLFVIVVVTLEYLIILQDLYISESTCRLRGSKSSGNIPTLKNTRTW